MPNNNINPFYLKEIRLYDEISQIKTIIYKRNSTLPGNYEDDIKLDRGLAHFARRALLENLSTLKRKTMYEYVYREDYSRHEQLYILLSLFERLTWYDVNTTVQFHDFVFKIISEQIVTIQHITDHHGNVDVVFE